MYKAIFYKNAMEKREQHHEINLNEMMAYQFVNHFPVPDELVSAIVALLNLREGHLFLDDLLKKRKCANKEELLSMHPTMYVITGSAFKKGDHFEPIVYNLWSDYDVQPNDFRYEYLFTFKLSQKSVFDTNPFLNYHLGQYYNSDIERFSTFLRLCIREYSVAVLQPKSIETIEEWIQGKRNDATSLSGKSEIQGISNIRWTGSKVDFIKLTYALYETGILNEGKGSKTKLTEHLAAYLGVNYNSKDNDLSKSIGESEKNGYDTRKFFDDLKAGFENYLRSLQKKNNS